MTTFDRVSQLAKKQGISLSELAKKLGFSSQYLYKWKTNVPKSDNLEKVADYFDVTTDYLLGRTDDPQLVHYNEQSLDAVSKLIDGDSIIFTQIIENLTLLNDKELKVVNDMIESIIELKKD